MSQMTLSLTLTPPLEVALRRAALEGHTSVNEIMARSVERELARIEAKRKALRRQRIRATFPELAD